MNMQSKYVTVLERELHYTERGADRADTVVMWHGLARTGRDFDVVADTLSARYRVICPDTAGHRRTRPVRQCRRQACPVSCG